MNILPHKSWHVRTKKNIARVRKDEAKAAEEEQKRQDRIKLAEREARTELLRQRARGEVPLKQNFISFSDEGNEDTNTPKVGERQLEHVNFFKDLEDGTAEFKKTNEEHEKEKKEEQEKYEKQIGYLTYLGQNTHESLGTKSWYNEAPNRGENSEKAEVNLKSKDREDPLNIIKKYTSQNKSKPKPVEITNRTVFPISLNEADWNKKDASKSPKSDLSKKLRKRSTSREHKRNHKKKHKKNKKKHKRKSRSNSDSGSLEESEDDSEKEAKRMKLENLRRERLKREEDERKRTEELIAKLNAPKIPIEKKEPKIGYRRQYNSQFNPELAKQNYVHNRR